MDTKNVQMMVAVSVSEWNGLNSNVNELKRQVDFLVELLHEHVISKSEYLTPKEVCEMLKIKRATYERYKDKGIISVYSIAGAKRKYAKKSEIVRLLHDGKF